jgi:hypothetical protein
MLQCDIGADGPFVKLSAALGLTARLYGTLESSCSRGGTSTPTTRQRKPSSVMTAVTVGESGFCGSFRSKMNRAGAVKKA